MPATSPITKPESWADAILLRPSGDPVNEHTEVPRFELMDPGWPDPVALGLAMAFLSVLLTASIVVSRFQKVMKPAHAETARELVLLPKVESPSNLVEPQTADESKNDFPQSAEPVTADPPTPELADVRPPSAPVQPSRPEPLRPTPLKTESSDANPSNEPLPRELMETPPPLVSAEAKPAMASVTPPAEPTRNVAPKVASIIPPPVSAGKTDASLQSHDSGSAMDSAATSNRRTRPASLGVLPLSDLIDDEAGLAASLNALSDSQRVNLPRVSIRVNAEWFAALRQTQERLYFSISPPQGDSEVLAYLPDSRTFMLERPERPLWQIRGAEGVSVLADLRRAAAHSLGVSPELVGLYTWHPPVLENALRMFVLERMQELHVQLGPRDLVTVRLAAGPSGTVMNLEPIFGGGIQ